jgi:hypothetical protein
LLPITAEERRNPEHPKDQSDRLLASEAANTVGSPYKAAANLRLNGATEAEIGFLLDNRVELNAFASDELLAWIEKKFAEHGVKKVIPDDKILANAYLRASEFAVVQKAINEKLTELRKTMTAATAARRFAHDGPGEANGRPHAHMGCGHS